MRHIINLAALLLGIAAAFAVCGCCGPTTASYCGPGTVSSGFSLGNLIVPPKPISFCEGSQIVCPDGWKVCGGDSGAEIVYVPMRADTLSRMMTAQPRAQAEPQVQEVKDGEIVVSRKVTTTYGEPAPEPAAAADCE